MATIPLPPGDPSFWARPTSDYAAKYPYNNVTQTKSGHSFEMDDSKGAERVRLQHRLGTFFEWDAKGRETHKIMGDGYEVVIGNKHVTISGICNVTVKGNAYLEVQGDKIERIKGDCYTEIQGDKHEMVLGESVTTVNGNMTLGIGGTAGQLRLIAQDSLAIKGGLSVSGQLDAGALSVSGSVTIDKGLSVGPNGINTLGGLGVGLPVAPTTPGVVTAIASVSAPLIAGITTCDMTGSMSMIRMQHNMHFHIAPFGPTSTPVIPMI